MAESPPHIRAQRHISGILLNTRRRAPATLRTGCFSVRPPGRTSDSTVSGQPWWAHRSVVPPERGSESGEARRQVDANRSLLLVVPAVL